MRRNLPAPLVKRPTVPRVAYKSTSEHTLERNPTSVTSVTKGLSNVHTLNLTCAHTPRRNHTNAHSVTSPSLNSLIWSFTFVRIPDPDHMYVSTATSPFPSQPIWRPTAESTLGKSRSRVHTRAVTKPSPQKDSSSLTFLFTRQ